MKKITHTITDSKILRQKAEAFLKKKQSKVSQISSPEEITAFIHQLEVNQLVLEWQNEELRQAKTEAEQTSQQLAELYNLAPAGNLTLDKNGRILEVNLTGAQIFGRERSQLKNTSFDFFVSSDSKPIFDNFLASVFQSKLTETCTIKLDVSEYLQMVVYVSGRANSHGEQCNLTLTDISAIKKEEEEPLLEHDINFEAILDASPDNITITDLRGNVLLTSPSALTMFGYQHHDELKGRNIASFVVAEDKNRAIKNFEQLTATKLSKTEEYRALKSDGSVIDIEVNGQFIRNSEEIPTHIVFFIRDITSRKQAEEALKKSEEKYRNIFESVLDTYYEASPDGVLLEISPSIQKITKGQYKPADLIGNSFVGFYAIPEERKLFFDELYTKGSVTDFEISFLNKDGSIVPTAVTSGIIWDDAGKPVKITGSLRDITDRKHAEKALRESEENYRRDLIILNSILESPISIIIFALDTNYCYTAFTKYHQETMKMLWGVEINVGMNILDVISNPHDQQKARHNFDKALKGEYFVVNEEFGKAELLRSYYENYYSAVKDADGNIMGVSVFVIDITQRMQAVNQLRTSEERFSQLVEQSGDVIWEVDAKGLFRYVSPLAEKVYGYTPEQMIGKLHFYELYPDNQREKLKETVFKFINRKECLKNQTSICLKADGTEIFISTNGVPILDKNGDLTGYRGIDRDITQRIKAGEALKKLSQAVEQSPVMTYITDLKGSIEYVNQKVISLTGYSREELIGKNPKIFSSNEKTKTEYAVIRQFLDNGKEWNGEFHNVKKNGEFYWVSASIAPVFDSNGNTTHFLAVEEDITARKLVEEAIKKSEEDLNIAQEIGRIGSWELDLITGKYSCSKNYYKLAGLRPYEIEITADYFMKILHPDDVVLLNENIQNVYKYKKAVSVDLRIIMPDGAIKWIQNNIVPVFEGDFFVALKGVNIDITEKKLAGQKIKEQNDRQNAIITALPDLIIVFDREGTCKEFCCSSHEVLLVPPEELIGTNLRSIFDEDAVSMHLKKFAECLEEKRLTTYEYSVKINDINNHFESRLVPFGDDLILALVRDITKRRNAENEIRYLNATLELKVEKRTTELKETNENLEQQILRRIQIEAELAQKKQRLDDIINGTNVGTWEWNILTGETVFNERWARIIGYSLDELQPVSIETWKKFAHPDDFETSLKFLEKHFRGETDHYSFESRMKHKNGEWVWIYDKGKVHHWDENGNPLLMSGTHQDINERKRAQEFENEVLQLSVQLTGIPVAEIDHALEMALAKIGKYLGADRAYIFEVNAIEKTLNNTFEWCNIGINPEIENLQNVPSAMLPMWMEKLLKNENINILSVPDLPESWRAEREILEPQGIQSLVVIPIILENNLIGFVGLDSVNSKKEYTLSEINILQVWSNMIASLLNHQRKEEIIGQTRRNYETFFNTIDDFLFVLDNQGNIIHTNNTVIKRLGYSCDELINKPVLMVHPEKRRDEAARIVEDMIAGIADFCPIPLISKSGNELAVETRITKGFWDGKPAIFGVAKDVSKIRLSEEKFSKAFHTNAALMAISTSESMKFIDINNTFITKTGYSHDEIIGKTPGELLLFNDKTLQQAIYQKLLKNLPVREVEVEVTTKSGNKIIGLFSANPIYIGNESCLLTMLVDITERKKAEEELRKARFEADLANKAKSEFLSRMSHELRTPMNSILGFAQLMEMGDLNPVFKKNVNHILKSGRHLLDLINEVLDIARIEAGKMLLSPEPVEIGRVIMEVLDAMAPNAAKLKVQIALEPSHVNKLFVKADHLRLRQILLNLVSNGLKYNKTDGSVIIRSELLQDEHHKTPAIKITVTDTGLGIASADIVKLFSPFQRIGAEKGIIEGTGLGLSMVKKLAEAMGGQVGVESEPGQGSTFWIELPQCEKQFLYNAVLNSSKGSLPGQTHKTGRILYIEDNPSNIELVEQILMNERPDISLISETRGSNAMSQAIKFTPDLILLDLDLPDIHGSEVIEILQTNEKTGSIPVIIISADAMPQQVEALLKAGAKDYLTKPLDIRSFLKVVDEFID